MTAIVVSYETRELLARCLAALRREKVATIVVDNASHDGSAALVREQFPEVELLALGRNVGFGAGCNFGVASARTEFVLLLNADTEVQPGAADTLVACCRAATRSAGAVPRLLDSRGEESVSAIGYPTRWWRAAAPVTSFGSRSPRTPRAAGRLDREFGVGAALLVSRDIFEQVGGFDAGFFLFYEEVDLCRRLQAAGWGVEYCPAATVQHVGGASTQLDWSASYGEQLRSHLRYIDKHEGRRAATVARLVILVSVLARWLFARGERRQAYKAGLARVARIDLDLVAAPAPCERMEASQVVIGAHPRG